MTSLPQFSVRNPVLVGVLMAALLVGGTYAGLSLVREMFPESRPNQVAVSVVYPGASPEEVEQGIARRMEEAIKVVDGIERIETTIGEGICSIMIEMEHDVDDIDQAVTDVKAEIDAIPRDELPEEAEEPRVSKFEPLLPVISVAVFGDVDERTLKDVAQDVRDDLLALPGVSEIELSGVRKAELTVEVRPEKLVAYNLSLQDIADAIEETNLDLPGGQVKTNAENVAVRTLGESDDAETIANTILKTSTTGEVVRIRDVGRVIDGFEDSDQAGRFNGLPAADITIYKTGDQDAIAISDKVKAYVAGRMGTPIEYGGLLTRLQNVLGLQTEPQQIYERAAAAPPLVTGVQIDKHSNIVKYIEQRLALLRKNGLIGLGLVFVSLLLFLNARVAFWVMMGLIVSICGALILMNFLGVTLNLITAFGLIVVLGIIVDDAIVVGENIYARFEHGEAPEDAAVAGAQEVTWPVVIAVLTTIGAFAPLMYIEGRMGDFMGVLPVVVMCALAVSLIESLSILPSHLAESLKKVKRQPQVDVPAPVDGSGPTAWVARVRALQQSLFGRHLTYWYEQLLRRAATYRYVTIACAVAGLIVAGGVVAGGHVPFVFIQKMDSETMMANVQMPVGTPVDQTAAALAVVEEAILDLKDTGELDNVYTLVGTQINPGSDGATLESRSHLGQSVMELKSLEFRERSSEDIVAELRAKTRQIPGVRKLTFQSMSGGPSGAEIEIEVTSDDLDELTTVAARLKQQLREYAGVFDIADDFEAGRREVQIELLDSARPLALTTRRLATEVRGAFYGLEARTIQRDREDVDIRVRYPEQRRRALHELEAMRIQTPRGQMVPLAEVARVVEDRGYATIRRIDQRRAVTVTADVDQAVNNAENILASLAPFVEQLEREYAGLRIEFAGNKREAIKSLGSLRRDFLIALALIYVMLAGLFKSYIQPLVVLAAVPFGLTGAIAGHFAMGYPLTILSVIGIVALTGIVVNDSLILVNFVNNEIRRGRSVYDAVIAGGCRRLRPILLTSLTTILGLAPLMTETSFQARFLIPMAISLSFGLLFATVLTLIVVPAIYLIIEDLRWLVGQDQETLREEAAEVAPLPT